ncbi:MAG: T9SS type A sorting domain-containing protein, partial [candidate division Zixibacteria bacterium]|nr:T9SS type A sorting domain-containing protein [candidate division Zixibacteria bacterium]
ITVSSGNRRPRYDWETHQLKISPDSADLGQTFHLTLEGSSSTELYNCDLTFTVEPARPYRVRIETLRNVVQGQYANLDVVLEEANIPLGSFDFVVTYDASVLAAIRATPGDFLSDCGWEYLTYDFGPFGPWVDGVPTGQMRIKAIATVPRGSTPSCFLPDSLPTTLFTIDILVTNDRTYECTWVPVQFYWLSCYDNMIRPPMYRGSVLSRDVYDSDGNLLTPVDSLPTFAGAPDDCLHDPKNCPRHRLIDFYNGGIDIVCADSIDPRVSIGDINLNGIAYEVADAVLFTNYFVYGEAVLNVDPYRQAAASDVNGDGELLTIEDFQWLVRVMIGDVGWSDPYDTTSPNAAVFRQEADGSVEVLTPDTLGSAWLVFGGNVTPMLAAHGMEMRYAYDGSTTRVLIYSLDGHSFTAGPLLGNVTAPLVEVQTCTYDGAKVEAIIDQVLGVDVDGEMVPTEYSLEQNYPNPFNNRTVIQFDLPQADDVTFRIYNVLGRVVYQKTQYFPQGRHEIIWDGRSMAGAEVAAGVYFYRIESGSFSETKKMLLLK